MLCADAFMYLLRSGVMKKLCDVSHGQNALLHRAEQIRQSEQDIAGVAAGKKPRETGTRFGVL